MMNNIWLGIKKLGHLLDRILDRIVTITYFGSGVCIALMGFLCTYGAIRRYVFRDPDPLAYVFLCLLMLFTVSFSLAYTQKLEKHISISFIGTYIPSILQKILLRIIAPLTGLTLSGVILWMTSADAIFALQSNQHTYTGIKLVTFPIKIMIPIGIALLFLILLSQLIRYSFSIGKK
jgi:TRAP-type C4-dicarboxylate transport system permease small subunit